MSGNEGLLDISNDYPNTALHIPTLPRGYEEDGPTAGEIWTKLKSINVNEHTEKKGKLTYLSWSWAYSVMMDNFPEFNYYVEPYRVHEDGTVTTIVHCSIGHVQRTMWLPVMDHRNDAIHEPDARAISDTQMRCLVKCIAMFGLGVYIYAGEDLPASDSDSKSASKTKGTITESELEKINTTKTAFISFIEEEDSIEDLRAFWTKNKKELEWVKSKSDKVFTEIKDAFMAKSKAISEQKEGK